MCEITISSVYQKINNGEYETKLHWVPKRENIEYEQYIEALQVFVEDNEKLEREFKKEAIEAVGLKDHPKADEIYAFAWDIYGHSSGFSEVFRNLINLAKLILP